MDLNARADVNCGRKDGQTEKRTPISHLANAGATINDGHCQFLIAEGRSNFSKVRISCTWRLPVCLSICMSFCVFILIQGQ